VGFTQEEEIMITGKGLWAGLCVSLMAGTAVVAQEETITVGEAVFPESIASTDGGDLLIGSFTGGTVYRVANGATTAEPWITGIGPVVVGVFAHGDDVYVCSNGEFAAPQPTLMVFDLATAEETASHEFPDGGFCSDIAVSPDGTVYVSDLRFTEGEPGRVLRLTDGGLEEVLADPAIRGIDGLAFLDGDLIGNDLFTGDLYRIDVAGEEASYETLMLSQPMAGPDGMRTTEDGTALLVVEQYGNRLVQVTIDGDTANVTEIAAGLDGPAGVAQIGNTAYVVEAHFSEMQAPSDEPHMVREIALP
jgi:sugar lactone lactonase YvrE